MRPKKILLVEDDVSFRNAIETFLKKNKKYHVLSVQDIRSAKIELSTNTFDLILSDIKMPDGTGLQLLEDVQKQNHKPIFILMTGFGTIAQSVQAMKLGAYDFLEKPFELEKLEKVLSEALEEQKQNLPTSEQDNLPEPIIFKNKDKVLITENPKMLALINNLKKIANSKATVLIQGESGTGKEVLANMVHYYSSRRNNPFIAINCAALPDNLLESELFGHEKGSFTGAIQRQIGKFELANGGTILLDEISEMSMNMQTKLLRVLQEREIYRIGGNSSIPLNIRIIASTNRDLYQYMKSGNFREDLFYRINVIPIIVPPLRNRGNDIICLSEFFLEEFAKVHEREKIELDELARHKIFKHPWHGNVRELRNAMERATLIGNFEQVGETSDNPVHNISNTNTNLDEFSQNRDTFQSDIHVSLAEIEKQFIIETLNLCEGNRTKTAKKLGISLRTLRNKLKAFKAEEESQASAR